MRSKTRFLSLVSLAALGLALASSGCQKRATREQCTALVDRLLELRIEEDPRARGMSVAQLEGARALAKKEMAADPDVKQVQNDCESQVTKQEYDCAIKAKSSAEWGTCIE